MRASVSLSVGVFLLLTNHGVYANSVNHSHGGRSHTHPLPSQGIAHRHNGGAIGQSMSGRSNSLGKHWIRDQKNCLHYNSKPLPNETVTWSGKCVNGYAEGQGKRSWFKDHKPNGSSTINLSKGRKVSGSSSSSSNDDMAAALGVAAAAAVVVGLGSWLFGGSSSSSSSSGSSSYNDYSSGSSSGATSSNTRSEQSKSTVSSASKPTGVKKVYIGSHSGGRAQYVIECYNRNSYSSINQRDNGFWYSYSSNMGTDYKGLSISEVARKKCK